MFYNPDLRSLCASARDLRDGVLRRVAAVGCEIDEHSLPAAQAVVEGKISEFLFSPQHADTRRGFEHHGTNTKAMTLLVLECAADLHAKLPPAPRTSNCGRRPDLRVRPTERRLELVTDNAAE